MNLNEQLQELYIQALHNKSEMLDAVERYNKSLDSESYATAWPLLLSVNDYHSKWPKELTAKSYQTADIKVMIFGQETMGWWGCYGRSHAPKEIMDKYDWFTSGYCFDRGGSFWHSVRRIMELLQGKNKDKKLGFLWNNVVKMGYQIEGFPINFIAVLYNRILIIS
ncbi:MAG: hypothetical protein FWC26_02215 [Fibromonadales bacterium]|nr:hypothetical protein [Fibromonadales bacterium]